MAARDGRVWSYEYLRVAAAFSVVLYHQKGPCYWLGVAGLSLFLLISFSLLAGSKTDAPLGAFAASRARRVLLPWVFWSAVYLAMNLLRQWRHGTPFFEPWMVPAGFSLHLWYLPFLFTASVVVYAVRQRCPAVDRPAGVGVCAALGLAVFVANAVLLPTVIPVHQWLTAAPSTLFGQALGRIGLGRAARPRWAATAALLAATAAVCAVRFFIPGRQALDAVMLLLGLALFSAAGAVRLPDTAAVRLLAPLTMGIYVVHPLVMDMFVRAAGASNTLLRVSLVFAASAALVYCMRKAPVLHRFV